MRTIVALVLLNIVYSSVRCQQQIDVTDIIKKVNHYLEFNLDTAKLLLKKIEIEKINDIEKQLDYYQLKGKIFIKEAKYDSALYSYFIIEKLCQKYGKLKRQAGLYDNIAYAYQGLRDLEQLKLYADKGLAFKKDNGFDSLLANSYYMLGAYYLYKEEYEKSRDNYHINLLLNEQYQPGSLGKSYSVLANAYAGLDNIDSAEYCYNQSLKFYNSSPNSSELLYVLMNYSRFLIKYERVDYAKTMMDSTANMLERTDNPELQRVYFSTLANLHAYIGNYEGAYLAKSRQLNYVAENFKKERVFAIREVEEKYKNDKKLLAAENEKFISWILIGVLLLMVIAAYILFSQKLKNRKLQLLALEKEKKFLSAAAVVEGQEIERKRIAQDLHDGLGVLLTSARLQLGEFERTSNEVGEYQDFEQVSQRIDEACEEVRKVAYDMMPGVLIRLGLVEGIHDLIDQIEQSFPIVFERDLDDGISLSENRQIIVYRIVQELFNNLVKHANASKAFFSLRSCKDFPEQLELEYKDNGNGFDPSNFSEGLGSKSINSRVSYLSASLSISTSPGNGVHYLIKIPQVENDQSIIG